MNASDGFDVVIVCCSSDLQAKYWQQRLEAGRGSVMPTTSIVLSVQEDWPGGAGNGACRGHTAGASVLQDAAVDSTLQLNPSHPPHSPHSSLCSAGHLVRVSECVEIGQRKPLVRHRCGTPRRQD